MNTKTGKLFQRLTKNNMQKSTKFVNNLIDKKIFNTFNLNYSLIDTSLTGVDINGYKIHHNLSALLFYIIYKLSKSSEDSIRISREDLSLALKCKIRQITNLTNKLEELNLITIDRRHGLKEGKPVTYNYYSINWRQAWESFGEKIYGVYHHLKHKFIEQQLKNIQNKPPCVQSLQPSYLIKPKGFSYSSSKQVFLKKKCLEEVNIQDWLLPIKEWAIRDDIDDGKIEFHLQTIKDFYMNSEKCSLAKKLKNAGKKFMVNLTGFYGLLKKWLNSLKKNKNNFVFEQRNEEMNKCKLLEPNEIVWDSDAGDVEKKILKRFGKNFFITWFGEKDKNTKKWKCRYSIAKDTNLGKCDIIINNKFVYDYLSNAHIFGNIHLILSQMDINLTYKR